MKKILQLSDR